MTRPLAMSGSQALNLQRRDRSNHGVKAKPSYVDESLFGSQGSRRAVAVEFEPPWVDNKTGPQRPLWWNPEATRCNNSSSQPATPSNTQRKKTKYRLKNHKPSYCDESLFGSKPGGQAWAASWMTKEDIAKLRPLLLTPPSAPKERWAFYSHPKEAPLRAVHREALNTQGAERFGTRYGRELSFRNPPESSLHSDNRGRARSKSLTRLYSSSDQLQNPRTSWQQDRQFPATTTGSRSRPCSVGTSELPSSRVQKTTSLHKPRPPWK
ncbi:hypothetical protein lerEdw1_019356 [Lerista edwardsae]|nr:hypothetical protein lerEdw1_019356 [Lerista edwardsae]